MQSDRFTACFANRGGCIRSVSAVWSGIIAAAVLAVAGCGSDEPAAQTQEVASPGSRAPHSAPRDPDHPVVEISTSAGAIRVKLDAANAPSTVRNFLHYASQGFYDDTLFHFVAPDKMIVGGGYGVDQKPKTVSTTVRNEADNGLKNTLGTIAMARDAAAGIDTATTQFFINLADAPSFDHRGEEPDEFGYCVFGEVVEGLDVAGQISRSATSDHGGDLSQLPQPPVVVHSISVVD